MGKVIERRNFVQLAASTILAGGTAAAGMATITTNAYAQNPVDETAGETVDTADESLDAKACAGAEIPASSLNESEISMRASGQCYDASSKTLEQRIQELEDIQAIRNLKFTYWDCVDSRDWDRYREVFTEDVHHECPPFNSVVDGRENLINGARSSLPAHVKSCHQGCQSYIEITGEDTAVGRWSFKDNLVNARTGVEFNGQGYYDEEYVKIDGRWYIKNYTITYNMTDAKFLKSFALDMAASQNVVFM